MPPAYEILLLNTAVPQIQAAQSGDTYVVPRDIAFSAALTLSAGTANGVPYLNGSKVLTSGSALTFDGTNLGLGQAAVPVGSSLVFEIHSGANNGILKFTNSTTGTTNSDGTWIYQPAGSNNFIVQNQESAGDLRLYSTAHIWGNHNYSTEYMRLDSTGLGIGTSSPAQRLHVQDATAHNGTVQLGSTTYYGTIKHNATGNGANEYNVAAASGGGHIFQRGGTTQFMTDASGNLGLGVTPSAWGSGNRFLDVNDSASYGAFGSTDAMMLANAYWNGSNWVRKNENNAFRFVMESVNSAPTMSWQVAANSTAGSTISWTQAMTLDSAGRLGVGATNPDSMVEINSATAAHARFKINYNSSALAYFGSYSGIVGSGNATDTMLSSQAVLAFGSGGTTERARITSGGDFQTSSGNSVMVGGTAARATTAGTNRVDIFDGTAPVGTLANGISLYSSSGEAYVMDAAGNATLFSPHDAATNEWIFRSKHTPTGKVLKIDVERLLKFVNDHFGLDAVHEFIED